MAIQDFPSEDLMITEGLHHFEGISESSMGQEIFLRQQRESSPEDFAEFASTLDGLSDKARKLALFLMEYPDELRAHIGLIDREEACRRHDCSKCRSLRRYLSGRMGWSSAAVVRAFRELRKKLGPLKKRVR